jgi:hypothetical protein
MKSGVGGSIWIIKDERYSGVCRCATTTPSARPTTAVARMSHRPRHMRSP